MKIVCTKAGSGWICEYDEREMGLFLWDNSLEGFYKELLKATHSNIEPLEEKLSLWKINPEKIYIPVELKNHIEKVIKAKDGEKALENILIKNLRDEKFVKSGFIVVNKGAFERR